MKNLTIINIYDDFLPKISTMLKMDRSKAKTLHVLIEPPKRTQ